MKRIWSLYMIFKMTMQQIVFFLMMPFVFYIAINCMQANYWIESAQMGKIGIIRGIAPDNMFQTIKNTSPEGGSLLGWCIAMIKMPAVLIVHRIFIKK